MLLALPGDDLTAAAAGYLAALAFPEPEVGKTEGPRSKSAAALTDYERRRLMRIGASQAAERLAAQAEASRTPRRGMHSRIERTVNRAFRSVLTFRLYRRRQRMGFRNLHGRATVERMNASVPSWSEGVRDKICSMRALAALNRTGSGPDDLREAMIDFRKRVLVLHSAALPLAYGLIRTRRPRNLGRRAIRECVLQAMEQPSDWLEQAVEFAQQYRSQPYFRGGEPELQPDRQILPVLITGGRVQLPGWIVPPYAIPEPRPPHLRRRKPKPPKRSI